MDKPTPAVLARPRRARRGTFKDHKRALDAQEPLRPPRREGRALSTSDFTLVLYHGHVAYLCPVCGDAVYPVTTLGQAYAKVRTHLDRQHP